MFPSNFMQQGARPCRTTFKSAPAADGHLAVSPEWIRIRCALLGALDPYPDARQAVVSALTGL